MYFAALWPELKNKTPVSFFFIHPVYNSSYYFSKLETDKSVGIGNSWLNAGSTDFLDNQEEVIKDIIDNIPHLFVHFLIFREVQSFQPEVLPILVHHGGLHEAAHGVPVQQPSHLVHICCKRGLKTS